MIPHKVLVTPDERYEGEKVIVMNETLIHVVWFQTVVCFNDLTLDEQHEVDDAFESSNPLGSLHEFCRRLEEDKIWECFCELVLDGDFPLFRIHWKNSAETLQSFNTELRRRLTAELRNRGFKVLSVVKQR